MRMQLRVSLLAGLGLVLVVAQTRGAVPRNDKVSGSDVSAQKTKHESAKASVVPPIVTSQSQENKTQATSDAVSEASRAKKNDAGWQYGGDRTEEYRKFSGVRYTPLDLAEYILRTRDEEGVALAIEELLREGLINQEEAILYLESVKRELQNLKDKYEHVQDTKPASPPHRIPQLRVQPNAVYESQRKKNNQADDKRSQISSDQMSIEQPSAFQKHVQAHRLNELQKQQTIKPETVREEQQQFPIENQHQPLRFDTHLKQQLHAENQQQHQLHYGEHRQHQQLTFENPQQAQQQQQQQNHDNSQQIQQLPLELARLVKAKAEQEKQREPNRTSLKSAQKTSNSNNNRTEQTISETEEPKPDGKAAYDDYLMENVIYQLAKDMFSQSMIRDNASAEQLLSRFATFLESELGDKRFSKEAQNKIMDTVSAALVESLRERLYLENQREN